MAASTDATGLGGPINVSVGTGALVIGGLGSGGTPGNGDEPANAVRLIGGSANTLVNNGFLATVGGISGFVVTGGVGDDSIVNSGRIDGSVDLSAGRNAIDNKPAGVFNSGSVVWLGPLPAPFDTLTNEGLLSPGGYQNVYTTNITGNLVQTATGVYGLDLNLDPSTDLINVTGTANMAGNVVLNLVNPLAAPGFATPGTHTETILHAQGGVTNSGLTLTAFDTAVINYSLIYPDSQDIALKYAVDYSPAGLTLNQHTVSYAVNAIQAAQLSPAFRPIATNLFYLPNVATLGAAYDSLSGEGVSASEQTAFNATDMFLSTANTQMQRWIQDSLRRRRDGHDGVRGAASVAANPQERSGHASLRERADLANLGNGLRRDRQLDRQRKRGLGFGHRPSVRFRRGTRLPDQPELPAGLRRRRRRIELLCPEPGDLRHGRRLSRRSLRRMAQPELLRIGHPLVRLVQ